MFRVFQSNRTEHLARELGSQYSGRLSASDALLPRPEVILTQSTGMAEWLKQYFARQTGIAANLEFTFPGSFIWRLYSELVEPGLKPSSAFTRPRMAWRLARMMEELAESFPDARRYLEEKKGDPQLRRLQLAESVADLFDQYLLYRPDWIAAWEAGRQAGLPGEDWMSSWWRQLLEDCRQDPAAQHRVQLDLLLEERLPELSAWPESLPANISVFGISSLAPAHLQTLSRIAPWCSIDIYLLNPCQHYWGSILPEKTRSRRIARQLAAGKGLAEEFYWMLGNPLLANCGRQGREFIDLLLDLNADFTDLFEEPKPVSALGFLQREILEMECAGEIDLPNAPADPKGQFILDSRDRSLSCHVCWSPLREVEVLHQAILHEMTNTDIRPDEILVMMPNVSTYAAAIEAVFNGEDPVPFSMVEQPIEQSSGLVSHLLYLLNLSSSRFTASEILDLLQFPAVRRKLNLEDSEELAEIRRWTGANGIRQGLAGESPAETVQSWQAGLQRLWLGYAMGGSPRPMYQGLLAADELHESQIPILEKLQTFIDILAEWTGCLQNKKGQSADAWKKSLTSLLNNLYEPEGSDRESLNIIESAAANLAEEVAESGFTEPLGGAAFRYRLTTLIRQNQQSHRFLSRGVTFCGLTPMRSIPVRMLCLLGLNDQDFPGTDVHSAIDLMRQSPPRPGDRSRRQDDRFLFLESLLSVRERLHLGYSARSGDRNSEPTPSTLLAELLDYAARAFRTPDGTSPLDQLVVEHPLQPFSTRYFADNPVQPSWSDTWYRTADAWQEARGQKKPMPTLEPDAGEASPELKSELDIEQLARFLAAPQRWYLEEVLDARFTTFTEVLQDEPPFDISGLANYQLEQLAIEELLLGVSGEELTRRLLASGHTLAGEAGRQQAEQLLQAAEPLVEKVLQLRKEEAEWIRLDLDLSGTRLTGQLRVHGKNRVRFRPLRFRPQHLVSEWACHLACNAGDKNITTHLLATKTSYLMYPLAGELAREHLQLLVQLYAKGQVQPAAFFPATALFEFRGDSKVKEISSANASSEELEKFEVRRFFTEPTGEREYEYWSSRIASALLKHLDNN